MATSDEDSGPSAGPPPAVKAILSKFSSGKEEDKLAGYLKMLKIGPDLLKFVPGSKANDLRTWLEAYRYWNQGGLSNVKAMLQLLVSRYLLDQQKGNARQQQLQKHVVLAEDTKKKLELMTLPELEVTPDVGLLHPLLVGEGGVRKFASNPKSCKCIYTDLW